MATDTNALPLQPAPVSPFQGLIDVFVNPGALFTRLRERPHWIIPVILISVVMIAQQYLLHPYVARATLGMINDQMSAQVQQALRDSATKPVSIWAVISQPVVLLLGLAIGAGILTGLAAMFTGKGGFKALFASLAYAKLITIPALALSFLVVSLRGVDAVNSMMDIMWSISPAIFISENKLLFNICTQLSLFEIWYLVVLVIAVRKVSGSNSAGATAAAVVYWLIGAAMQIVVMAFAMGLR